MDHLEWSRTRITLTRTCPAGLPASKTTTTRGATRLKGHPGGSNRRPKKTASPFRHASYSIRLYSGGSARRRYERGHHLGDGGAQLLTSVRRQHGPLICSHYRGLARGTTSDSGTVAWPSQQDRSQLFRFETYTVLSHPLLNTNFSHGVVSPILAQKATYRRCYAHLICAGFLSIMFLNLGIGYPSAKAPCSSFPGGMPIKLGMRRFQARAIVARQGASTHPV